MRAFIEMLLNEVSFACNMFGDNHAARIREDMFPIGAEILKALNYIAVKTLKRLSMQERKNVDHLANTNLST